MDYQLSKVLGLLSTSGSLVMLALLLGVFLLWRKSHWRAGRALLTILVLLLAGIIATPVQPWLTALLEDRFPAQPPLPAHVDGIIVLGGAIRTNVSKARGRPTLNDAAERLIEGARLARLHPEARLLFTGGNADPWNQSAREAGFAGDLLQQLGVAPDRLLLEDGSRNTYENALFSLRLLPQPPAGTWVLVTSALHMPRSVGVFRRLGWQVTPWPVSYLSGGDEDWVNEDIPILRLSRLSRAGHEWIGMVYYYLRGWSQSLLPEP
jgi:uncharacterized SAM-binding protein YcdF (DUF218 family)